MKLFSEGENIANIARELRLTDRSVRNHLHAYLETQSLYPSSITAERVAELRQLEAEHLTRIRQKLCESLEVTSAQDAIVRAKLADACIRTAERLARLYGLDAAPQPTVLQQNNFVLTVEKQREIKADMERLMPEVRRLVYGEQGGGPTNGHEPAGTG